jgi:hypothetical protein
MKRSDLKVGEAYYHDRSQKWASGDGHQTGKAIVLSLTGGRDGNPLVDLVVKNWRGEEVTTRTSVTLAHLRGPWDATLAEVTARNEKRIRARQAVAKAAAQARERVQEVLARATTLGVEARGSYRTDGDVVLAVAEFEKLLDLADIARAKGE